MMRAELVKVKLPKDEQREDLQLAGTPESVLILWRVSASVNILLSPLNLSNGVAEGARVSTLPA